MVAQEQSPTPPIGSQAPSVRTPIAADVNGNLQLISSDVFPDPRFYEHSVDELLAAHKPFVFTIYSPAFCPTTACGPLLRYLKEIATEFPAMTFVHAEPYVMRDLGGRIQPEYEGGRFAWASWSTAYGIPVEPYVFVVDADGTDRGELRADRRLRRDPGRDPDGDGRVGLAREVVSGHPAAIELKAT